MKLRPLIATLIAIAPMYTNASSIEQGAIVCGSQASMSAVVTVSRQGKDALIKAAVALNCKMTTKSFEVVVIERQGPYVQLAADGSLFWSITPF